MTSMVICGNQNNDYTTNIRAYYACELISTKQGVWVAKKNEVYYFLITRAIIIRGLMTTNSPALSSAGRSLTQTVELSVYYLHNKPYLDTSIFILKIERW